MPEIYTSYVTGEDSYSGLAGVEQRGQTFSSGSIQTAYSFKALVYRQGSPGTVTCSLYATSAKLPTGGVLCSGVLDGNAFGTVTTGDYQEFVMTTAPTLSANTLYAACLKATNGVWPTDRVLWIDDESLPTYSSGTYISSSDSGATWTETANRDFLFEEWGNAPPPPPVGGGNGLNFGTNF